jgi:hypothetical protein
MERGGRVIRPHPSFNYKISKANARIEIVMGVSKRPRNGFAGKTPSDVISARFAAGRASAGRIPGKPERPRRGTA